MAVAEFRGAAAFATAAANTINDIYDVDIDRVNKPRRPLAAGTFERQRAIGLYALFFAASVFLMLLLGKRRGYGSAYGS